MSSPPATPSQLPTDKDDRTDAAGWLSVATGQPIPPAAIAVLDMEALNSEPIEEESGPNFTSRKPYSRQIETVRQAVAKMDCDAPVLYIVGDTPAGEEWIVIGRHFKGLRHLVVSTGFMEQWDDTHFPLDWELDTLVITDACGELVTTPVVLEGLVKHFVLLLTCGLRFDGPSTKELIQKMTEDFELSEVEAPLEPTDHSTKERIDSAENAEGKKARKPVQVYCLSDGVMKNMAEKYAGGEISLQTEPDEGIAPSKLRSLSILENDALEQFVNFAVAKFYLVAGLSTLTLRSTAGLDNGMLADELFGQILPQLGNLQDFRLSLNKEFSDDQAFYANLWQVLPPNLEALHFRGPMTMADELDGWVQAFKTPDFQPRLKCLSFVLDLDLGGSRDEESNADEVEQLRQAKRACRRLAEAAEARGVVFDEFDDPWARGYSRWKSVDERWAELDVDT